MSKQIKLGMFLLLAAGFFAACKNDGADSAREEAVQTATPGAAATDATAQQTGLATTAPGQPQPAVDPNAANAQPPVPTGPTTAITFAETEFNYGKVKAGEKVQHEYKFKNTGKNPLIISDAKGSCGCTVPKWPKEPIAPGGSGSIMVEFDSKGKNGPQTKQVTVTANTEPVQTIIQIKGEVIGDPAATTAATPQPSTQVKQ